MKRKGDVEVCSTCCCSSVVLAAALTAALVAAPVERNFIPRPAPAISVVPTDFSGPLQPNNAIATHATVIAKGELAGPETVTIDPRDNSIISCTDDGVLHRLTLAADGSTWTRKKIMFVGGRPHVCEAYGDNSIIMVDAVKGLVIVDLDTGVQSIVSVESDDGIPIMFANDLVVDSVSGAVYFSDASQVQPWHEPHQDGGWTAWKVSVVDLMFGQATGRLLKWDPLSGRTTTLMSGLWFANGVTLTHEGDAVLIAETFEFRVHKYYIRGPHAGSHHVWTRNLPGAVDGVARAPGGGYLATIPAIRSTLYCLAVPKTWVRRILSFLPMHMWPGAHPYGLVVALQEVPAGVTLSSDPHVVGEGGETPAQRGETPGATPLTVAELVGSLQDPEAAVAGAVTSVTPSPAHGDGLFLGSISGDSLVFVPGHVWKAALAEQSEE